MAVNTYSSLSDLRASEILLKEQMLILADRASLWGHPSIVNLGNVTNTGTLTLKVGLVGLDGYDKMAAVAEDTAPSNTSLTDGSVTITVARQAILRTITTQAIGTDPANIDLYARIANDCLMAASMRFMEMIANITDDFTNTVGTSGADLTVDDFYSAVFYLEQAGVAGPYIWNPHPVQFTDFQRSLRAEGGAIQFRPDTNDLLNIKGQGMVGNFAGVEIFKTSYAPTANAGADRASGMWGYGAIGFAEMLPPIKDNGVKQEQRGRVYVSYNRDNTKATEEIVGDYYVGVATLQNAMGVSLITDA